MSAKNRTNLSADDVITEALRYYSRYNNKIFDNKLPQEKKTLRKSRTITLEFHSIHVFKLLLEELSLRGRPLLKSKDAQLR